MLRHGQRYAARSQEHAHLHHLDDCPDCHRCSRYCLVPLRHRQTSYDDAVWTQRSRHHVQGHHRLLEEDPQGRRGESLLQGCLVQRDQRHGRRLCVGAVRRDQEVHINFVISLVHKESLHLFKS
uniref:Solute carrier family 25 member 4 n=1 Tax=Gasterosteus aculeatus TaxID=69293 RepID=G3Q0R7_GASAC